MQTVEHFAADVRAMIEQHGTVHLVHVDYNSTLDAEQVQMIAERDFDGLYDSIAEWWGEAQHEGARWYLNEYVSDVRADWLRKQHDMDYDAIEEVVEEYLNSEDAVCARYRIGDHDASNPIKDMAHNSGWVLMRQVIAHEDVALYGEQSVDAVFSWLTANAPEGSYLSDSHHNRKVVEECLNEAGHSQAYLMGMLVYAVRVGDLYDLDAEEVEIVNPHLYLGNYYNGDGWCSDTPLEGTFRVRREHLTTDRGAAGYGWDEVAGVVTSAYEAEIRPVETVAVAA